MKENYSRETLFFKLVSEQAICLPKPSFFLSFNPCSLWNHVGYFKLVHYYSSTFSEQSHHQWFFKNQSYHLGRFHRCWRGQGLAKSASKSWSTLWRCPPLVISHRVWGLIQRSMIDSLDQNTSDLHSPKTLVLLDSTCNSLCLNHHDSLEWWQLYEMVSISSDVHQRMWKDGLPNGWKEGSCSGWSELCYMGCWEFQGDDMTSEFYGRRH